MAGLNAASANLLVLCSPAPLRERLKPLYRELEDCVDRGILPGNEDIPPTESAHRKLSGGQGVSKCPPACGQTPLHAQPPREGPAPTCPQGCPAGLDSPTAGHSVPTHSTRVPSVQGLFG